MSTLPLCARCETQPATVRATHLQSLEMPFCSAACSKAFCQEVLRIGNNTDKDWGKLPQELKLQILSKLPFIELLRQSRLSREVENLASDKTIWKDLYERIAVFLLKASLTMATEPLMPTWKQQLIAYMNMRDFLVVEKGTRRILRYLPMRSFSLPAIIIELGEQPSDDQVYLHRPDIVMTLISRLVGHTTTLHIKGRDKSWFSLPVIAPMYPPPTIPIANFLSPHVASFPVEEGMHSIFDDSFVDTIKLSRSPAVAKDNLWFDPTAQPNKPERLVLYYLPSDAILAESGTQRGMLHMLSLQILENIIVVYDNTKKNPRPAADRARYPLELEYFLFTTSPRQIHIQLQAMTPDQGFWNIAPLGAIPKLIFNYKTPSTSSVPAIGSITMKISMPSKEFADSIYTNLDMSDPSSLETHERLWHRRDRKKQDAQPFQLQFKNQSTVKDGFHLIIPATISLISPDVEQPFDSQHSKIRVRADITSFSWMDPILERSEGGGVDRNHSGDYSWPPCELAWKLERTSQMPPVKFVILPPDVQESIDGIITKSYGDAIRTALPSLLDRPLTELELTYTLTLTLYPGPQKHAANEGTVYHFPVSNTYCLLPSPGGDDVIYEIEKGGPHMIAKKLIGSDMNNQQHSLQ